MPYTKWHEQWTDAVNASAPVKKSDLAALEQRIATLEAVNDVNDFMFRWARILDLVETVETPEESRKVCERMCSTMMTPQGVMDFSGIPGWLGVWGPNKKELTDKFVKFSGNIRWSYHLYCNTSTKVDLDRGTARYTTTAEMVPLVVNAAPDDAHRPDWVGNWLFLTQVSDLKLVNGRWLMHRYTLTDLRQTLGDLSHRSGGAAAIGGSVVAGAETAVSVRPERSHRRRVLRRGDD